MIVFLMLFTYIFNFVIAVDCIEINHDEIESFMNPNSWSEKDFGLNANIAKSVQDNLEDCAMQLGMYK